MTEKYENIELTIRKMFYDSPVAMAINDLKTLKFIRVNKEFTRQTEFTEDEIFGKTPMEIGSWPDMEEFYKVNETLKKDGRVRNIMVTVKSKSGKILRGSYSADIIEYDGKLCILGHSVDITETQKVIEKEKTKWINLFDNMPSGYNYHKMIYDDSGKPIDYIFLEQNKASIKLVKENFIGKTYKEWLGDIKEEYDFVSKFGKVVTTGESVKFEVFNIKLSRWYSISAYTPKKDHFVAIFDDITDKINLEEQLKQAAKLEAIGLLAGGVAHDFNNILTVIRGYTELLINKCKGMPISKQHKKYVTTKLDKIDNASNRAEVLTKQLLAFGRKQIMTPDVINLNDVFRNEIGVLSTLVREDIEVIKHLDGELGNCYADSNQISLVMMNLILNARDAIPVHTVGQIIIETKNIFFDDDHVERKRKLIDKGQYVMFAVTDDGIGMDKITRERIFEPFFTTKELGKGVGLGLSTAYGIIKQSGGFVWVYSEIGQGTTFKIYFPRVDKKTNNNKHSCEYVGDLTGTETLLVVEDEKEVRLLICETLKDLGYKILSASDGIEAIELVKNIQIKIDMMVTDVVMPKLDGRELAIQLSDFLPNLKVLYMSGYTDNTIVHRGVLDPGTNFIQKPVTPTSLAKKIREILDNGT